MKIKKYFPVFFMAVMILLTFSPGLTQVIAPDDADQPPCRDCHICKNPTNKAPCLKQCLRGEKINGKKHSPTEGPDVAILDQIEDMYSPVRFDHKRHAEMVGMGQGCEQCHHYSPEGRIPPCRDCHGKIASETENLRKPGLKGAFHRQCMGCHREWSHATECIICHVPTEGEALTGNTSDRTDIAGIAHPIITEPEMKVYYTPYESGPVVTFYHQEHIDLFGLRCVDCHQEENCAYCHDLKKPANLRKTEEEIHAICSGCHSTHKCSKCHDTLEKPAFSHADTGWPLNKFHRRLDCRACHPTGKRIAKLNNACTNCHEGWNQETFAHAAIGLQLDEVHSEIDCGDCHIGKKYQDEPECSSCHDDGRDYKENPPGKRIETAKE